MLKNNVRLSFFFAGLFIVTFSDIFVDCEKVLVVFAAPAHSHFTLGLEIAKRLAEAGHEVDFVSPYPQKVAIKNLKDISVAEIVSSVTGSKDKLYTMATMTFLQQVEFVKTMACEFLEAAVNHKNFQDLLNSQKKYDVIVMEHFVNDIFAIIPHKLKAPYILVAPGPTTFLNNHLFSNPTFPSYIPNLLSTFSSEMTFWQRLTNTYYDVAGKVYNHLVFLPEQEKILKKAVPDAPDLQSILYNASMMLLASHVSLDEPVPLQPNIKEIGGYHVTPPEPLPDDLKKFLDDANEGVVLFSMGSNLKSADFPEHKRKGILEAFAKIKQKVLWKFETDLPEKPSNVKIMAWLPQRSVLAHRNVVAFISHGGLLGITEATYYGVPVLGIPVFWDQEPNVYALEHKGAGVCLPFKELDGKKFARALEQILNDSSYRRNAKRQQMIMHDRPLKPIDEAVYWIEYVIRHNGAPHLRSAGLKLNFVQRHLIEIVLFLVVVNIILFVIFYFLIRYLLRLRCSSNNNAQDCKKNK